MTDISDSPSAPRWTFNYSYMSDSANNATYSRYDHDTNQHDEVCRGILGAPKVCLPRRMHDGSIPVLIITVYACSLVHVQSFIRPITTGFI